MADMMTTETDCLFSVCEITPETQADSMAPVQSTTAEADHPVSSAAADGSTPPHFTQYVLHPPLPAVIGTAVGSSDQLAAIPLLLNPDILQSSKIPVITPQLAQVQ